MKRRIALLVLSIGLLVAAACQEAVTPTPTQTPMPTPTPTPTTSPTPQPRQVAVGREFTFKIGNYVEIATANFLITFDGIIQDSRCPKDVTCVRAGSVTVELKAAGSSGQSATLKLTIGDEGSPTAQFGTYDVTAVDVQPYPISTETIDPAEYEVTLLVQAR